MAVQWYTEVGPHTIHPIALLAQLKLAPDNLLNSFDILPMSGIINGAYLIENDAFHWAIQSPREQERYIAINAPSP